MLNGKQNGHVSEESREKILQAVYELGYHTHTSAQTLRKGYSAEICLILDVTLSPFATELITSIQQNALLCGYSPVIYFSQGLSAEERGALHLRIFARRPLGILVGATGFTREDAVLAQKMGVKHIIFISFCDEFIENTYSISFPSRDAGYLAARHLLIQGHRHLALVHPADPVQQIPFAQRQEGMLSALAETPEATLDILPLCLSASVAHELVEERFTKSRYPTGIYAFSDEYALLLLGALTRRGIQVPQDVALVGTDNLPFCDFVYPSLTSICFDGNDMGKRAVGIFDALQKGLPLPDELVRPLMPQLILRESS